MTLEKAKMVSFKAENIDKMFFMESEMRKSGITMGDTGYMIEDKVRDLQILATQVEIAVEYIKNSGFEIVDVKDDIDIETDNR